MKVDPFFYAQNLFQVYFVSRSNNLKPEKK